LSWYSFQSAAMQQRIKCELSHEKFGKSPSRIKSSLDGPRRQIDLSLNAILPTILRFGHSGKPRKRRESRLRATNVPAKQKKMNIPSKLLFAIFSRECRKHPWKNPLNLSSIGNCPDLNLHLIITSALRQKIDICATRLFSIKICKKCWSFHRMWLGHSFKCFIREYALDHTFIR